MNIMQTPRTAPLDASEVQEAEIDKGEGIKISLKFLKTLFERGDVALLQAPLGYKADDAVTSSLKKFKDPKFRMANGAQPLCRSEQEAILNNLAHCDSMSIEITCLGRNQANDGTRIWITPSILNGEYCFYISGVWHEGLPVLLVCEQEIVDRLLRSGCKVEPLNPS